MLRIETVVARWPFGVSDVCRMQTPKIKFPYRYTCFMIMFN
jgi:hypothetical protein